MDSVGCGVFLQPVVNLGETSSTERFIEATHATFDSSTGSLCHRDQEVQQ